MLNIGDIVRPIEACIGHNYTFEISERFMQRDDYGKLLNKYKLKRLEHVLDSINGPIEYQLKTIKKVEDLIWYDDTLELVKRGWVTEPIFEQYEPQPDKPQEITSKNLFDGGELMYNYYKNIKEDKIMKILDIYAKRKELEINQNYIKNRREIIEEDEMQKIIREMELQINTILDIEERLDRVDFSSGNEELLTNVSKEKLEKLEAETDKERDKLHDNIEEIKALFELTEDYEERMKILKKYDIINKDGKVSI